MNKYEVLFNEIYDKTEKKQLKWKQISKASHSDLIYNPSLVFRMFSADFVKDSETFELLFVEKKYDDPEHDFIYEKYASEILVVDKDNELLLTLTDSVIDDSKMIRLVKIIEVSNERVNKLFK